jgi:DNA-binding NarL/FixJ family response regulator
MIRVAVFEDNKHLRDTLRLLIDSADGFSCAGVYATGSEMRAFLDENPCDVVLMDIEMPGLSGIEATRLLKSHQPLTHVLIQTAFFDDTYIFEAICAGASGYLLKTISPTDYLDAIRDTMAGGSPMTPGIARRMLELFRDKLTPPNRQQYHLTEREREVLHLLVEGKSYRMIAAELFLSLDTIKTHIRNIYTKLHVNSGTEAVAKALRDRIV